MCLKLQDALSQNDHHFPTAFSYRNRLLTPHYTELLCDIENNIIIYGENYPADE